MSDDYKVNYEDIILKFEIIYFQTLLPTIKGQRRLLLTQYETIKLEDNIDDHRKCDRQQLYQI